MAVPKKASSKSNEKKTTQKPSLTSSFISNATNTISNRALIIRSAIILLITLVVLILTFGVLIYRYKNSSSVVYDVAKVVPYPIMTVNGRYVTYREYLFEVNAIKHFYQNQTDSKNNIDFKTTEGKAQLKELENQVLDQLKSEVIEKQLIAQYKIKVSAKEVKDQVDQITQQAGGDAKVKEVLSKYYGWTYNDFKEKVKFQIATQKLQDAITNDKNLDAQVKAKAEDILAKVKAGGNFADLAKQYSQDSSAANGGDLGFFGKGQMVTEFENAAFALQVGQVSDLVKSKYGYHIIKVIEKKDNKVHAAQILIKAIDPAQYIKDQVSKAKIISYFKI